MPVRSQEEGRPPAIQPGGLTWESSAGREQGHESRITWCPMLTRLGSMRRISSMRR